LDEVGTTAAKATEERQWLMLRLEKRLGRAGAVGDGWEENVGFYHSPATGAPYLLMLMLWHICIATLSSQ